MNGIEVLTEIKKRQADLPVIIITGYGTIEHAVEAIKSGADDFVTTPFDPDHLALVVSKALERPSGSNPKWSFSPENWPAAIGWLRERAPRWRGQSKMPRKLRAAGRLFSCSARVVRA